jgi:hypothetical protein
MADNGFTPIESHAVIPHMGENMATEEDMIKVMNTMVHHRLRVQEGLQSITHDLERRALVHDESKFRSDEFNGFANINKIARDFVYGSDEYKASLREEGAVQLHYSRNSHHPEYYEQELESSAPGDRQWGSAHNMSFLDIIEMVCDWHAAWKVYNGQQERKIPWMDNVDMQEKRFGSRLNEGQWWMVEQVANYLENK